MVGHPYRKRGHHVSTRSLPLWQSRFEAVPSRAGGRTVHHHATTPPLTSPHVRPLVSARHPSQRQPRSFQTLFAPRLSLPAQRASPTYRVYATRHCCTTIVVCMKRCSRCSAEGAKGCATLHALSTHSLPACSGTVDMVEDDAPPPVAAARQVGRGMALSRSTPFDPLVADQCRQDGRGVDSDSDCDE
jgi:hypothetical protein